MQMIVVLATSLLSHAKNY